MSLRAFTKTECKVWSVRTWRHGSHTGVPKQLNSGQVGEPNQSCGSSTFYLWNTFFQSNKFAWLLDMWVNMLYKIQTKIDFFPGKISTLYNLAHSRNHDGLSLFALICASTPSIQMVKPAYKPSGPPGQSLSRFQKHEVKYFYSPWMGC